MLYDVYGRTEASRIYLAKPGKKLLGCLNGTDQSSCSLTLNLINAHELSFDVYKYHDEEPTNYYDYVDILMQLYVDGFGWYVISESPTVHNDGIKEYKTVVAKSYEHTLGQYDLVSFDINTASPTSREMMATDNVYTYSEGSDIWYNLFRDRVLFYRDTSQHKELLENLSVSASFSDLKSALSNYPKVVYYDWRITISIDSNLRYGFVNMKGHASTTGEANFWQNWIDNYDNSTGVTSDAIKALLLSYPNLIGYINVNFDKHKYIYDGEDDRYVQSDEEYTAYELMELEYKRIKELSLLDLVLSVAGVPDWEIGVVDNSLYSEHADANGVPIRLCDEVGSFEVDSQDVYSFLVTQLSGYFDCIFTFDTVNNKINALRIETLGTDTKIFLGFRNVQNSVEITPAQDLFTQFTVQNSEGLTITDVNFGERELEDISYFLNTKYLSQELIDKYNTWKTYRDGQRDAYVQLSRDINAQNEVVNEIKTRVPSDMLNISQLDNYTSLDQLEEVIDNYYALMVGILNGFIYVSTDSVTPPNDSSTYNTYSDYITAMNNYINQLYALVDVNKESSATAFVDSLYYKDYSMMKDFTVPNLVIAHNNLTLPSYETKQDYYDSYEYDFATYGDMYGLDELYNYQKMHLDSMNVKKDYSVAWNNIPNTAEGRAYKAKFVEAEYTKNHNLYIKYRNGYNSVTAEIAEREAQYDNALSVYEDLLNDRQELADSVNIKTYSISGNTPYFSTEEVAQISRLYKHTDYVNDNIAYLNNIDTTNTLIDKQLEMYKEAVNELFAEAHPQYIYSTSVDDLLANNEYELYHPEFEVGNFIRIGLDDETQVKLRVISIQFNPMIYDENLQITFSNMTRYLGKRNDFQSLLDSALTSAKNAISARYVRSADSDSTVQVTYDLIQKIMQSSQFSAFSQNIQAGSVNAATGTFNALAAGYIKTDELSARLADIDELHSDSAFINYLNANLVVANAVNAQSANFATTSTTALSAESADIATLATESLSARSIDANNIDTSNLTAQSAFMQYLSSNLITSSEIDVNDLKAKLATINTLAADSAFVGYLTSLASTTATSTIDSAYITNAVAQNMAISDLQAGDIVLSNQMRILTESTATEGMIMSGSELQFLDGNGNPSISIGYNTISDGQGGTTVDYDHPAIVIKDSNGSVMLNSTGLSQNDIGIAPMVQSHTIGVDKLSFDFIRNQNGEIVIGNWNGDSNTWGRTITEFLNGIDDKLEVPNPTDVDVLYAKGNSNSTAPTTDWVTTAPSYTSGKYVWEKVVTTYDNHSSSTTTPVCIQPSGNQYSSILEQYYKSSSDETQTGGSWSTTKPTWEQGYYIWTRSEINWTSGDPTYSTPVLATPEQSIYTSTINTINDIATQDANGNWSLTEGVMSNTYVYTDAAHQNPVALSEFASSITTEAGNISALVRENYTSVTNMITDESNKRKAMYGVSRTRENVADKDVDCDNFELHTGATISVEFIYENTQANPTLNVENTGVIPIKSFSNASLSEEEYSWSARSILDFIYDGTSWRLLDNGVTLKVSSAESQINMNADNIAAMVTVDGQTSSITLTENMLEAITGQFIVKSPDGNRTIISGGLLSTDAIQSNNYVAPTGTIGVSGTAPYSVSGSKFDLSNGNIITPNFMLDSVNGNAYLTGTIETGAGHIGGFTITQNSIYNNMSSIDADIPESQAIEDEDFNLSSTEPYVLDENDYLVGGYASRYGIYMGLNGIALGFGRFRVDADGLMYARNAIIQGDVTASSGNIGGWKINSNAIVSYLAYDTNNQRIIADPISTADTQIYFGNGLNDSDALLVVTKNYSDPNNRQYPVYLKSTGYFRLLDYATGQGITFNPGASTVLSVNGSITASDGKIGRWNIRSGFLASYANNSGAVDSPEAALYYTYMQSDPGTNGNYQAFAVRVRTEAQRQANSPILENSPIVFGVDHTGSLTATKGTIGGWTLESGKLRATDSSNKVVVVKPSGWVFAAGGTSHDSYDDCPFRVNSSGSLYATRAYISGSGKIGSWTITDSILYGYTDKDGNASTAANAKYYVYINGNGGANGGNYAFGVRQRTDEEVSANSPTIGGSTVKFGVTHAGYLYAANANITGQIKADTGRIGGSSGWTIEAQHLYSGTIGADSSMHLGTKNLGSSTSIAGRSGSDWRLTVGSKFGVNNTGNLYCTGGIIGGWTINASTLSRTSSSNTVTLNASGIAISNSSDNSETSLKKNNILISGGDSGAAYVKILNSDSNGDDGLNYSPQCIVGATKKNIALYFNCSTGNRGLFCNDTRAARTGRTCIPPYSAFVLNADDHLGIRCVRRMDFYISYWQTGDTSLSKNWGQLTFYESDDGNTLFRPNNSGGVYLGSSANRWSTIFTDKAVNTGSDLKTKNIIEEHDWKVDEFIQGLKPIAYNLKNSESGRIHMGFGAQDVAKLVKDLDIGDLSLYQADIVCEDRETKKYHGENIDDSNLSWGLKYSEFIAPMVLEIQRLMDRVTKLENELNSINQLNKYKGV